MGDVTTLIHKYLRHNKKFPHVWCPGCGNGIVLGALIRAIDDLQYEKDEVVLVSGIGCSGRLPVYADFNTLHTTHGRALTFATGVKLANPKLKVIVVMGDGDALFGIRPDIVDLGQGSDLGFDFSDHQFLDIGRFHARKQGDDNDFTDDDGRILLAGKGQKLGESQKDKCQDENDGNS